MTQVPQGREREAGLSLIEVVVALFVMSTAVLALVGGLSTSIVATDMHRKSVTADALVRNWAEQLQSPAVAYVSCAATTQPTYQAAALGLPVPAKFAAPTIVSVEYWDGNQNAGFTNVCTPATDKGVERITLGARSSDDRGAQQVQILKRKP
jgi:Tfp pilus assembly protein PilV